MRESKNHLAVLGLVVAVLVATFVAGYYKPIRLGLDLQGGLEVVLKAVPSKPGEELTQEDLDKSVEIINNRVNELGVAESETRVQGTDQIAVELPGIGNPDEAAGVVGSTAQLHFYKFEENVKGKAYRSAYDLLSTNKGRADKAIKDQADKPAKKQKAVAYYLFKPAEDRVARNPVAGPAASESALIDSALIAGVIKESQLKAPKADATTAKKAPAKAAKDTAKADEPKDAKAPASDEKASKDDAPKYTAKSLPKGWVVLYTPPGERLLHGAPDSMRISVDKGGIFDGDKGVYLLLTDKPCLSGERIEQATAAAGQGGWTTSMDFDSKGGDQFGDCTEDIARAGALRGQNLSFAIVLDDKVVSAPYIDYKDNPTGIKGGNAQITGLDSRDEAQDIALVLNTGSLPVKFETISKTQVSATLGEQELKNSLFAGAVGLAAVMIWLVVFYRWLGLVADLALLAYAFIFYGLIVSVPITMTLPGIAGMILTIGVAADANIIIFERIREEYRAGRSVTASIGAGYRKGLSTIVDANVVTLITALVLFLLGSGSVRGFALLLGVGVILSMLTAVAFTYAVLGLSTRMPLLRHPWAIGASRKTSRFHVPWMRFRRAMFTFTAAVILVSVGLLVFKHLDLGVDFKSGTKFDVVLKEKTSPEDLRLDVLGEVDQRYKNATIQQTSEPAVGGGSKANGRSYSIRVEKLQGGTGENGQQEAEAKVRQALDRAYGVESFSVQTIGPSFGKQIVSSAIFAVVVSLLLLVCYIWARFEFKYSIPVLIALTHDMVGAVGAYALFDFEFKSATVAALLTILGYSLYDTIIVFDRVRENVGILRKSSFARIVTTSLNEVLTRSLNTTFVVLLPIIALLVAGGETLKDFAFALLVGVFFGAYSSIIVAAPILCWLKEREPAWARRIQPGEGSAGRARTAAASAPSNGGSSVADRNGSPDADPAEDAGVGPSAVHGQRDKRSRATRKKR